MGWGVVAAVGLAGLLMGAVALWLWAQSRLAAQASSLNAAQAARALAEERARVADGVLAQGNAELRRLESERAELTGKLTTAREAEVRLGERANRVPELEGVLTTANANLARSQNAVLELSSKEARLAEAINRLNAQVPQLQARVDTAEKAREHLTTELSQVREVAARRESELSAEREQLEVARGELSMAREHMAGAQAALLRLTEEHTAYRTKTETEREAIDEKLAFADHARDNLTLHFRNVGNELLADHSKQFAETHRSQLSPLLEGLRSRLSEFQQTVAQSHTEDIAGRSALGEQVRQLYDLSQTLNKEANNLADALRGSSKTQGNWGELMLERVLQSSGLRRDHEYVVQDSRTSEEGRRYQPDVVIRLPENRHLVVDAKVSLNAYELMVAADNDEARALALRQHLDSMRNHIKGLSGKRYQDLYKLESLDFVLMFVPIEPAFIAAVTHDGDLFMQAFEQNVLMVSPSTILFVVRTVAHLWRQEAQNRNAQAIAARGAFFFDKLSTFVKDLENVGTRLRAAQDCYDEAYGRLTSRHGGVIRQAEMLRDLGVKPSKNLPANALRDAGFSEEETPAAPHTGALLSGDLAPILIVATAALPPIEPQAR